VTKAGAKATSRRVLVVGFGNPDRGDDGVGVLVAQNLRARLPAGVTISARFDDALSLIDDWANFDALVCVDAAEPMGTPGRIHRIDLTTRDLPHNLTLTSSHAFGLAEVIALARTLELAPQNIVVYAIEGRCFDNGAPLTPDVAVAAAETAERIIAEVDALRERSCANDKIAQEIRPQ
jgi:hydrogenase maturation protease